MAELETVEVQAFKEWLCDGQERRGVFVADVNAAFLPEALWSEFASAVQREWTERSTECAQAERAEAAHEGWVRAEAHGVSYVANEALIERRDVWTENLVPDMAGRIACDLVYDGPEDWQGAGRGQRLLVIRDTVRCAPKPSHLTCFAAVWPVAQSPEAVLRVMDEDRKSREWLAREEAAIWEETRQERARVEAAVQEVRKP